MHANLCKHISASIFQDGGNRLLDFRILSLPAQRDYYDTLLNSGIYNKQKNHWLPCGTGAHMYACAWVYVTWSLFIYRSGKTGKYKRNTSKVYTRTQTLTEVKAKPQSQPDRHYQCPPKIMTKLAKKCPSLSKGRRRRFRSWIRLEKSW